MRGLEIENSIEQLSIVDLFDIINIVDNDNATNDEIVRKIEEKIEIQLKEKEDISSNYRELLLYMEHLKKLNELIEKDIALIEELLEKKDTNDILDILDSSKNEILDYSLRIYGLETYTMLQTFNEEEKKVYGCLQAYNLLEKYFSSIEQRDLEKKKNDEKHEVKYELDSSRWKTYFYFILSLDKQQEYNQLYTTYIRNNSQTEDDNQVYIQSSKYYASDFQGQLSKNIYCKRKRMKLTQKQLSERSGIDRTMIAKIEKVQQPTTLETAIKLLSSLNMGIAIYSFD